MRNKKMKILFLTNVPSPYRVHFFNELGKQCDLTVLYQKKASSERNSKWVAESSNTYTSIFLKGKSTGVDNAFCPGVVKYLRKSYDAIIICGNASPTEIFAIEWCKLRRIPYCMEGDGAFVKTGKGFKERLKRHLIRGGTLFFSTCKELDNYYIHYGANPSKIVRYRFSSLLKRDILLNPPDKDQKLLLRNELKIKEDKVILAVGQFIYRKGFDVLIESATMLNDGIGIYIVGDNPTSEYLSKVKEYNLKNIHFEGFKTKDELKKYYMAADAFVLPTREDIWGLVINEAMAYGLPVVTTDRCNAGVELIDEGVSGFIVKIDDVVELANAINILATNSVDMGRRALLKIRDYSIEMMASDHMKILQEKFNE